MEKTGLDGILYCFLINSACMICANATFTEVPKDVSVGEGDDVEMPCAFKAVSSAPMSLEIQWWYLKKDMSEDELQITAPANRAKDVSREATKISTVRVQGNAISHSLSLSKVKKKDEGVYECRVSDLWADESQEFNVHATLHVTLADSMVAEEAVSHIQNRGSLRNTITALGVMPHTFPPGNAALLLSTDPTISIPRRSKGMPMTGRGWSAALMEILTDAI
uniref:V-set and transmembrane domain containing 2B n=1 Tax=Pundamilia nyererei TaxID=303518 RepID=A0A3B4G2V8_9CICH